MTRKILSIVIVFIAVCFAGLVYGSTKSTFLVPNLSAGSCLANITSNLQQLQGTLGVKADLQTGLVVIDHDDQLAAAKIVEIINSPGCPAQIAGEDASAEGRFIQEVVGNSVPQDGNADRDVRRTSLLVENMSCSSCLSTIEAELRKLNGSLGMSADLSRGIIWVDHRAGLDCNIIAHVVSDLGYPATVDWTAQFNSKYAMNFTTVDKGSTLSSFNSFTRGGCDLSGGGGCGASASAWKRLFNR